MHRSDTRLYVDVNYAGITMDKYHKEASSDLSEKQSIDTNNLDAKTSYIANMPILNLGVCQFNTRKNFGDVTELKQSIEENGILQPLLPRR